MLEDGHKFESAFLTREDWITVLAAIADARIFLRETPQTSYTATEIEALNSVEGKLLEQLKADKVGQ